MPKIVMLRATVVNGEPQMVGQVLDVSDEDAGRLGDRAELAIHVAPKRVKIVKAPKVKPAVKPLPPIRRKTKVRKGSR